VLHGRTEPLRLLRGALDAARAGHGQLVLISGEAGIGKSAVALELAREAEASGVEVTWGRAWEFADAPPYFPVSPCLRSLGVSAERGEAFQLWEIVVERLSQASREAPRLWVIEDLHAADLGTLDLLTFLAQPLRALRVLVVLTLRDRDLRLSERMVQRISRMAREGLDIRLEPLEATAIAALVQSTLGHAVTERVQQRLIELTGGNPLFVLECARAWRNNTARFRPASVPATVRQVVLDRVSGLPSSTRQSLQSGAVLGREFSAAAVARMCGSLPARVVDALLPALRSGLLNETRPGQFLFSHALVRDAIEEALAAGERVALHARADAALAALGEGADVLVERARHALGALPEVDESHCLGLAQRALKLLESDAAFDRACELLLHLEQVREAGLLSPATPEQTLHFAEIARAAGRTDVARSACERVAAAARAQGQPELFARAVLLHAEDVRPDVIDRRQVALLEEARLLLGDGAPSLSCRVLARYATALQPAVDQAAVLELSRAALQLARSAGDEEALIYVLEQLRWGMYLAPLEQRLALGTELLERALARGDGAKTLAAYTALAFHRLERGELAAFERCVDQLLTLSDRLGHPRHRWRPLLLASMRSAMCGRFAECERFVAEVSELAALVDDPSLALALATHERMRRRLQRHDAEMRAAEGEQQRLLGEQVAFASIEIALYRAACCARSRDVAGTVAALSALGTRAELLLAEPTCATLVAEAYALAGTEAERRSMRERLEGMAGREPCGDPISFMYEGPPLRAVGLLSAALGEVARAVDELEAAHRQATERGHWPWVAQTAFELAELLQVQDRVEAARGLREQCLALAREFGMTSLEQSLSNREVCAVAEPEPASLPEVLSMRIEHNGRGWRLEWGAHVAELTDSRGLQLLARLIQRPDQEIHVLALASDEATSLSEGSAGALLDAQARAAYRQRLLDLDEELAESERLADLGRREMLQAEREALLAELARAVGLGGRTRSAGSATERARVNVQRRIKDAVARISASDAALGRHLERSVRTGTFCVFRP